MFRLITLNLNGIRSAAAKGFVEWAQRAGVDCMGVQEVRAQAEDVAGRFDALGPLQGHFHFARKEGMPASAPIAKAISAKCVLAS